MAGFRCLLFRPAPSPPATRIRGNEFDYVLSGSIFVEPDSEKPFTLMAGQATFLPRGQIHKVSNASAVEPAEVLTVLIHEIGKPLAVPVL